jgi:hypothetical protein
MVYSSMTDRVSNFCAKSALRDFKIKLITEGDIEFQVLPNMLEKYSKELEFLSVICPNDIITGSLALNLYGLIYRDIHDIDVLIKDKNRYDHYFGKHSYSNDIVTINRLGFKEHSYVRSFKSKNIILNTLLPLLPIFRNLIELFTKTDYYQVDYFVDNDSNYNTFEYNGHTFKIHNVLDIIEQKLLLMKNIEEVELFIYSVSSQLKHKEDLFVIFKNINW